MTDEIDLRPYLMALIKHWKLIVGTAVLVGLLAFALSSLQPRLYESSVLVAITIPRQVLLESLATDNTDPRFATANQNTPPYRAFPDIAVSNDLLQSVLSQLDPPLTEPLTLEKFKSHVEAEQGIDQTLVYLHVRLKDAEESARVANLWGNLFVAQANEIFGNVDDQNILLIEDQLEQATSNLTVAEQALVDFQSRDNSLTLQNQLTTLLETQLYLLSQQQELAALQEDVAALRTQIAAQSGNTVNLADQITALALQLKAFGLESALPLQLQTDTTTSLTAVSRTEQIAALDGMLGTLDRRTANIENQLATLGPQLLNLQEEKSTIEAEREQLVRTQALADETYIALSRRLLEERLTSQDARGGIKLISLASVPELSLGRNRIRNTVLGGMTGFVLACMVILMWQWWRSLRWSDSATIESPPA